VVKLPVAPVMRPIAERFGWSTRKAAEKIDPTCFSGPKQRDRDSSICPAMDDIELASADTVQDLGICRQDTNTC
jgi:hypothetical protein